MIEERVIIALDFSSADKAYAIVEELGEAVNFYKIGISLFTRSGPEFIKELIRLRKRIFLDLKFFDIPNSMVLASLAGIDLGVSIINFHCMAGGEALKEVSDKLREYCNEKGIDKPLLIGVTVLTSMEGNEEIYNQVIKLAGVAKNASLDGVVCSPLEISSIKEMYGRDFKVVVPGIRLDDNSLDDQKRTSTAGYAFRRGADYIVVGRPVIKAEKPLLAFKKLIEETEKEL